MEYLIIFALQFFGIGLNVAQVLLALDKLSHDDSFKDIWKLFWQRDKVTLIISGLVLGVDELAHFIFSYYDAPFTHHEYYIFISFGIAFVLGYAGQRLIYKYLGTAEKFLNKKIDEKLA